MSQPPHDPPPPDPYAPPAPGAAAGEPTLLYPVSPPPGSGPPPVVQPPAYRAAPTQPPAYAYPRAGHPAPVYGPAYPEPSQATLALVFGIVGIVVFPPLAPFAWWLGSKERSAIDASRRDPANRGQAVAGWVLGIVGTVLLGLAILFGIAYVIFIVVVLAAAGTGGALSG